MNATQVQCDPHDSVVLIKCKFCIIQLMNVEILWACLCVVVCALFIILFLFLVSHPHLVLAGLHYTLMAETAW